MSAPLSRLVYDECTDRTLLVEGSDGVGEEDSYCYLHSYAKAKKREVTNTSYPWLSEG